MYITKMQWVVTMGITSHHSILELPAQNAFHKIVIVFEFELKQGVPLHLGCRVRW